MPRLKATLLLSLATLSAPLLSQSANPARPGTINYVEGQASINGQALSAQSIGQTELEPGQTLQTANGKAEVLLTPGVFLRLGNNSAVSMVTPNLTKTEVEVLHGQASLEVDQLYQQNNLLIDQGGAQTQILKEGLYEFNADGQTMKVFDGKAAVFGATTGAQNQNARDDKGITVKGGKQISLATAQLSDGVKPAGFDKKTTEATDQLYNWGSLRSQYLGEANLDLAEQYDGYGAYNPGWYWDAGLFGYTWLPGNGLFWNPYGYGFYSPYYVYGGGFIYGGRGLYNHGILGRGRGDLAGRGSYGTQGRSGYAGRATSGFAGRPSAGFSGGVAHSSGGFAGGGFHGGGGGFGGGGGHAGGGGHR